jgi:hypothetical protein
MTSVEVGKLMTPHHRILIEAALARSPEGFTFDDITAEVASGRAMLWTGEQSAAVTYVRPMRAMWIWAAGGNARELARMSAGCEAEAKRLGCDVVIAGGREGWSRVLQPIGYQPHVLKEI